MNPVQRAALKTKVEQKPVAPVVVAPPAPKPVEKPPQPAKKPKKNPQYYEHARLPDGSSFSVAWDAEKQLWFGGLDVPGVPHFQETSSGVFRLLKKLDNLYRKHLEEAVQVALPLDK